MKIIKNYILFDLEAIGEFKGDDFMEIVEIAALKIGIIDDLECRSEYMNRCYHQQAMILDSFQTYIKPVFHTHMPKKINRLIKVDMDTINKGADYEDAIHEFIDWAGEDAIFISWSDNDKRMIEENNEMHYIFDIDKLYYLNLQKEYDRQYRKQKRTGLSTAITELGSDFSGQKHSALYDSYNMLPIFNELIKTKQIKA